MRAKRLPTEIVDCVARVHLGDDRWALVDLVDLHVLGNWAWRWNAGRKQVSRNSGNRSVVLHRVIMKAAAGVQVDHINGDPLDNRRENLRLVTNQENSFNSVKKRGKSRFKGVHWHAKRGKWNAMIRGGTTRHLGLFVNEEDAARAYDDAARALHGKFACVNFPKPGERSAI